MSSRALMALVFFIAGLLAVVILVGLVQKTLDTAAVAVCLSTVLTGIVSGALLRGKDGGK